MSLKAPVGGGDFERELPPAGMMHARCVAVLDLGTHTDPKFVNERTGKPVRAHKVQLQFELDATMEYDGQTVPMMATMRLTLSSNEKSAMRKHLESWYGKKFSNEELEAAGGFDVEKLLGRPALLNLTHSADGKYANITSINPPMRGVNVAPQHYPSRFFELSNPSEAVWNTLSKKTREFIANCEEVKLGGVVLPAYTEKPKAETKATEAEKPKDFQADDDSIPF